MKSRLARVVGRLRYAPGRPQHRRVFDLASDDEPIGLLDQAAGRRPHDDGRHQVLEHRARPRDQRCAATHRSHRTTQAEPMPRGRVPLGDRHEARQSRLRGEKVIAAWIERALGRSIADRQQQAVGVDAESRTASSRPSTVRYSPAPAAASPSGRPAAGPDRADDF